jgi:hypothetical protein
MIIPWRLLFEDDRLFHAKDPTDLDFGINLSEVTSYIPTTGEKTANYILGILFIFLWTISFSVNPILFQYFRTTKTKTTNLFKCLSVTDFITNLWCPLTYAYCMLSPKIFPSSYIVLRYNRIWTCMIGCFSQVIGFLLAVYRAAMIIRPKNTLEPKHGMIYFGGFITFMAVDVTILFIISEFFIEDSWTGKVMKIFMEMCIWSNLAHCSLAVFISVCTLLHIYYRIKKNPGNNNAKYISSCITILLLNMPYLITVVTCVVIRWATTNQINMHEFIFGWVPIVTSVINPMVIATRNSVAREAVIKFFHFSG